MRFETGQYMRMEQRMKLSPRMIQSMEILQLASQELEERIEQELEQNPVLELAERHSDGNGKQTGEGPDGDGVAAATPDEERPLLAHDSEAGQSTTDDFARLSEFSDTQSDTWESNVSESGEYLPARRYDSTEPDAKMEAMANTAARSMPLVDQLLEQWRFVEVPEDIRKAGAHVISFIDDDGYLRTSIEELARQATTGITIPLMQQAVPEIQKRLDLPGIGARDLRECLLLQLDALIDSDEFDDDEDPELLKIARELVADHLKDIEMNRLPRIVKATGYDIEKINAALARLRRLDPHPGRRLAPERPSVITPDVMIEYDPVHDRYVAALNRGRQPALRINPQYRKLVKDRAADKTTRDFLGKSMSNARWLIDAIQQRNNTLLRVVNAVLDVQRDFMDHGEQHLKPLPMIQVADQLGIHVGTVSRAVADKYIQTPRGIFPLRMFFSGGTESASGDEMSWAAVQAKLEEIISHEDKANPWSDDQLVEQLKAQGIEIARRTVAKYRQQLNIPPARRRKQF